MNTLSKPAFLEWLKNHAACVAAVEWVEKQKSARAAVENCERVDWLEWLAYSLPDCPQRQQLKLADEGLAVVFPQMGKDFNRFYLATLRRLFNWEVVKKGILSE